MKLKLLKLSGLMLITFALILTGCTSFKSTDNPSEVKNDIFKAVKLGNTKDVSRLLTEGADVNAKDKYGDTLLHSAAYEGRKEMVELLIAKGAEVNAKNIYGGTPLHFAATFGHKDVVELLTS